MNHSQLFLQLAVLYFQAETFAHLLQKPRKLRHKGQIYCQIPLQALSYKALNGVKTFEHKNALSAAQNKSKKTVNKTANNATNATIAANVSAVANTFIHKHYGRLTP